MKPLPEEHPSQPAPAEAKAITWGLGLWIIVGAVVVMALYIWLKH